MERRSNLSTFTFLFVSLAVLKIFCPGITNLRFAFALAYSYLWLAPKILRLNKIQTMFGFVFGLFVSLTPS